MANIFCIDCKRPIDDHAPDCECATATDLIETMGRREPDMWPRFEHTNCRCVLIPVGAFDPFLPGRHDVGYPKHEGD